MLGRNNCDIETILNGLDVTCADDNVNIYLNSKI